MFAAANRVRGLLRVAIGIMGLAGCVPGSQDTPPPIDIAAGLQAEYVVANAAHPTALAFAPDGRVFFTEKNTGQIRVVVEGVLQAAPFATVPVNYAGDRGLLGLALHPTFELLPRVYVFYTRSDTGVPTNDPAAVIDNRVVYFEAAGSVAVGGEVFVAALPAGEQTVRVGGRLAFSPDGTLFVALGDLGNYFNAQNTTRLAGKVLRYNADGTIPADNPVADSPIFARGFRDPSGLSFDPATWFAFVLDRNAKNEHEINRIVAGGDYGWPEVVGLATTDAEKDYAAQHAEYVDPLLDSGSGSSAYVGGGFNPSSKYGSQLALYFFYGSQTAGEIKRLQLGDQRAVALGAQTFAAGLPTPLTDVTFTPTGTLYVAGENAILRAVSFP